MPTRPHAISELAQFSKDDSPASSRSVKDWLRVADHLRKTGYTAQDAGDLQAAFLYLARSATYILDKIPHNPGYHELNENQMANLKNNGHEIIANLEKLKPKLVDRYEEWLAKDPNRRNAPSELQQAYGAQISPMIPSRAAAKRQNSFRDPSTHARAAVSQQYPMNMQPNLSMNDLTRDLEGVRLNTSPRDYQPPVDLNRRAQEEAAARRQREDAARRQQERETLTRMAQEDASRRQWEMDEERRRRQHEEQRIQAEQERAHQARTAAASNSYAGASSRYRENSIASSVSSVASTPYQEGLPHHPLQAPQLDYQPPIWQANHTPTSNRSSHSPRPPLDTSFANGSVHYPQLMSAHQLAQGYQPSVLFPSPVVNRGGTSSLYNHPLPQPSQAVQYPPPRTSSYTALYSPAPPPPSTVYQEASPPSTQYSYDARSSPQSSRTPSHHSHVSNTHRRKSSIPEVSRDHDSMRPIDMPVDLLDRFLMVAKVNTLRKIETCGLLLGKQRTGGFIITTLLIPEQRGTPDTCVMESEELVVEFSTDRALLTLGWIHTHPTQSCFMSSLDLHTHSAYQSTLKEAIAIVCAPTSEPKFGIFRLTDPPGLDAVMSCRVKETFHPHPEHLAIYTDCDGSHVRLVNGIPLEIVDLRRGQDFSSSEGTRGV